ncbi:MAG: MBL fold metallo-hydrolase [Candidatus Bathyarchaeota archaeon]|nr:MBL fold metallo-hydrolase [Candidatus Bathyarchaeota archaeon]
MKLTENIYLVGGYGYGYSAVGDCNIYMIDCGGSLAIVDTGGGKGVPQIIGNIERMGFDADDLEVAFISHCHFDHIGGNKGFKEATGCRIAAHEAEKEELEGLGEMTLYSMGLERGLSFEPVKVDTVLRGGESVKVGSVAFQVVHTPGHSPGGISLLIEDGGSRCLFPGDTASALGRLGFINGPGFVLPEWKSSIKKMMALEPDMMFPGHGTFLLSGAMEHLAVYDEKLNSPWVNIVTSVG